MSGTAFRIATLKRSWKKEGLMLIQFERIAELKEKHHADGNPVISVDTKKKEQIGNLSQNL
jgi:hypothetical protein